jgi:PTH2 family peptidyl-tRNA hydrolase
MSFATKQVIVIRKDLKMRRGKEIAQGAHASMAWLSRRVQEHLKLQPEGMHRLVGPPIELSDEEREWIEGSFAKVTVRVNSEEELREIEQKAREAGLEVHLIIDSGKTEFDGVPTPTALAIGPHRAERIDEITGNLQLY